MKPEELLGLAIPLVYILLLAIESRYAARAFEQVRRWRWTGGAFFVMVLVVGSIAPLLLPLTWFKVHPLLDLSGLGLLGIPVGLLAVTFLGYWLHRAEHKFDWLWRAAHQLHHSPPRVDMAGAYFTHPVEVNLPPQPGRQEAILSSHPGGSHATHYPTSLHRRFQGSGHPAG